jgi:glycogen operon protein
VEGPAEDAGIAELRERVKRAMLVTLFTSLGTPMLLGGDEFGRTQQGNNNAYCQDNEVSWIDWMHAAVPSNANLAIFTERLLSLRRRHAIFRSRHFLHGHDELVRGVLDIDWLDERGQRLSPEDWSNSEGRALVMGLAARDRGKIEFALVLMNASDHELEFHLPAGFAWRLALDSFDPEKPESPLAGNVYGLRGRSAAIAIANIRGEGKDRAS